MNSKGESASILVTSVLRPTAVPPQQHADNYASSAAAKKGAMSHAGNCKSIVSHSSIVPLSSLLDAAAPVLSKTRSLLAAVSNYMNSTKSVKRRHSPNERNNCCLCHMEDDSDRTAIHTLEELKAFVHNDVAEMLRPIWSGISTLKTDMKNSCEKQEEEPPLAREGPVRLQMVSGDVRVPDDGTLTSPGSTSVLTDDSHFPAYHSQRSHHPTETAQADQMLGKLPLLVEGLTRSHPSGKETQLWYSEKLKEKNQEIEALQATVYDLVSYQQKFTLEFEKVKRHLLNEAQRRPSSSLASFPDGRPTLYLDLLDSTCKAATAALDSFTTHFVAYSEARLHVPANKIWKPNFRNVYLAKESHWTYALKAFFCEKMFVGFENESFTTDAASLFLDPAKLRKESYAYFQRANSVESSPNAGPLSTDAHFRIYSEQKFHSIIPDAILLQPGDYDEDDTESSFPTVAEINLSKSFSAAATKVWSLHKLCFAFEPAANIFRARRGVDVDWKYMESVVRGEDDRMFVPKVGFMIVPGFRLRDSTVKSQIYLAGKSTTSQVGIHGHLPM